MKLMLAGLVIGGVLIAGLGFMVLNSNKGNELETADNTEGAPISQTTAASTPASDISPTTAAAGILPKTVEVEMEAGSFYFKPNKITVKQGDTVKVTLTSKDMMHDFQLDEFNVKGEVTRAGNTSTVEFIADKTGSFEFYCGVGNHRQNGQVGTLTVE